MKTIRLICLLILLSAAAHAEIVTVLPSNCTVGDTITRTGTPPTIWVCTAQNVWTQPAGAGGGGGAPTTATYLTGTSDAGLSNEIVVPTCAGTDKLTFNGSAITCATDQTAAGGPTRLILGGDISTAANTTPVTLTGMTFTATAAKTYQIDINGFGQAGLATTGYGIGLNCVQVPQALMLTGYSQLANAGTVSAWSAIANNAIVGVTSGIPTGATNVPIRGGGIVIAHATVTGTCTFILRSETTAITTMKTGSLFTVTQAN